MQKLRDWLMAIEKINPNKIELGLSRVQLVAEKMQLTHFTQPVIVVGGTNGKGSTVTFLKSILEAEGYSVGATLSPHLFTVNERFYCNGMTITDEQLVACLNSIEVARGTVQLTYFEFLILAALSWFKEEQPDVMVLEVGLGGRLDAVNVVDNDIAVITSIALDHMDFLGETRELIAFEKAGIFKPEKSAVVGDIDMPACVAEHANSVGTKLYCAGQSYHYTNEDNQWSWTSQYANYQNLPKLALPRQNAATALMVVELLQPLLPKQMSEASLRQGLASARLAGRWQAHPKYERVWLDVAHNPASVEYLAQQLSSLKKNQGISKIFAVFGMLDTKDIMGSLVPILPWIDAWYIGTLSASHAINEKKMGQCLQELGCTQYHGYDNMKSAWHAALKDQESDVAIVVFGSFVAISDIEVE